jgi:general secretion pathway protein L
MSRVVGIDVTATHVRAALLRVAYRKTVVEDLREVDVSEFASPAAAIAACVTALGGEAAAANGTPNARIDSVGTTLDGRRCFVHRLSIPLTAEKTLPQLLPFELEAVVPVDLEELVFDYELGRRDETAGMLEVFTVAARTKHVEERIALVSEGLGREPESVGVAPVELGQLSALFPELNAPGPLAVVELSEDGTDICILEQGRVTATRSLGLGTRGFPGSAETLAAQLRQTLTGHAVGSGATPLRAYLLGSGAGLEGVHAFLADRLGMPFDTPLECTLDGVTGDTARLLPRFARSLATAQRLVRGKGLDLRQGALAFQRGFGFLKEKTPLLLGLGAAVLISFLFATWAESRALDREREALEAQLESVTSAVFGQKTTDPEEAHSLVTQAQGQKSEDPMPHMDGFGVAVAISEAVPMSVVHDIEELDVQKGKLTLRGIVNSTEDAQTVSKALDEHRCIEGANITKITQVVNSQRQKYLLEATVRCPEDPSDKKKAPQPAGGQP